MILSRLFAWTPVWCGLLLCLSAPAWAKLDLYVEEPLTVYSKPDLSAKSDLQLSAGQKVLISPKIYGSWRKVLVRHQGQRVIGYVRVRDLVHSYIREGGYEAELRRSYGESSAFGISMISSFMEQGDRQIKTSVEDVFTVDKMTSHSSFISLFYDRPVENRAVFRVSLGLRQTQFIGKTHLQNSTAEAHVKVEQTLLALGFAAKFYSPRFLSLWWGGMVEVARGSSVSVTLGDEVQNREEKPFFVLTTVDAGWDFHVTSDFYILPSVRLGAVVTTQPYIPTVEALLSFGYTL